MKNFTLKVLATLLLTIIVVTTQAQLKEVTLYCHDDWTIDDGHPDAGVEWGNNICNNDQGDGSYGWNGNGYQEAWMKWDLSFIVLESGEEIISADVLLRSAGNFMEQGYHAIVLDDNYDDWIETNFSWNGANSLGDFMADGGDTLTVVPVAAQYTDYVLGEHKVNEKFSIKQFVEAELAGNKKLTLRMKPYYATFDFVNLDDKKWLGLYSRQPHETWGEGEMVLPEGEADSISAYAPRIKFIIGKPANQFSKKDWDFGNIENYNFTPEGEWYAVEDNTGNGRLIMLRNNSYNPDSIGATAIYKDQTYSNFELTLDARVNDALVSLKTNVSIIFDYIDEANYKCFTFYGVPSVSGEALNGVYQVVDNVRTPIGTLLNVNSGAIPDDEYHTYSIKREGSKVTASIDGAFFHEVDDLNLGAGSGQIGFGSAKFLVNFDNVTEASSLGIYDESLPSLNLYPNPVKNTVNVSSDLLINNIVVRNMLGKTVYEIKNVNDRTKVLNLDGLVKGVYIVSIESEGRITAGKLVKE